MEALVALGLASNVVQLVTFTGTLLSEANSIRKKGEPSSLVDLKRLAKPLVQQASIIKSRLEASSGHLEEEHQYLLDTAQQCETTGDKFLSYLDKVAGTQSNSGHFGSLKQSFKYRWRHDQLNDFVQQLDRLRGALILGTLLAFRSSSESQNEEVVQHLKQIQQHEEGQTADKGADPQDIRHHFESIESKNGVKIDALREQITACLKDMFELKQTQKSPQTRENKILRWLNFRQMSWRFDEIDPAHQRTFEWIFLPSSTQKWDNLAEYLADPDVSLPYFIKGKPGSGKSTLMKFIIQHSKTTEALRRWSEGKGLLVPSYFFWNLGTPMQKTITGMLRSLLYDVLSRYPELIPAVFPKLYRLIDLDGDGQTHDTSTLSTEPAYVEVKKAFDLLREKSAPFLRLCLFIDGIDELDGDHSDVSRFLRSLGSANIKLVVSSRPINACLHAFTDCPTLELQHLTRHDMDSYARDRFDSHHLVPGMRRRWPVETEDLLSEISEKAEGIFLWTRLVVQLLLSGIDAGDNVQELRQKLDLLPSDLRHLYSRMLASVPEDHQIQASQFFQLHYAWRLHSDLDFAAIVLVYAHESPLSAVEQSVQKINLNTMRWQIETLNARIRSRCCGLLETTSKKGSTSFTYDEETDYKSVSVFFDDAIVGFIHRTVSEFLHSPDIWSDICALTKDSDFDPAVNLAAACLAMIKAADDLYDRTLQVLVFTFRRFCQTAKVMSDNLLLGFTGEIDKTLTQLGNQKGEDEPYWATLFFDGGNLPLATYHEETGIHTLLAASAVPQYFRCHHKYSSKRARYAIVLYGLRGCFDSVFWPGGFIPQVVRKRRKETFTYRSETIALLLTRVASPEDVEDGVSLWEHAIGIAARLIQERLEPWVLKDAAELLRLFFMHAREPCKLLDVKLSANEALKPLELIQELVQSTCEDARTRGLEIQRLIAGTTGGVRRKGITEQSTAKKERNAERALELKEDEL